ncbi:hypothetical protein OQH60_02075 [Campylobacter sp. MIT 21-1685]|uniref:hypothetical protein n=1 Tax=unclassified Campylobacter TaxID=2593542 RepID=UPI00224A97C3|nr:MULTISPECIES: hypothetical protein [unclassified Campylobacter]MCX2682643.1 hypothetical protein [Campylobacter sp. MIT 21-1684]MCX2750923.1 hypothetical protein [Campylobacter sp. MIT 21-1682]MCX2807144.1 hypothetical protein [Campylobacter sp. MIT 21-1685]
MFFEKNHTGFKNFKNLTIITQLRLFFGFYANFYDYCTLFVFEKYLFSSFCNFFIASRQRALVTSFTRSSS